MSATYEQTDEDETRVLRLFGLSTLVEATDDNWPWIAVRRDIYDEDDEGIFSGWMPYFPDHSPAAMRVFSELPPGYTITCSKGGREWRVSLQRRYMFYRGETLGEAVLKAIKGTL